ncbi:unnamed protein product [Mytilus edulis]|uniref:DZIP3-like HEPN domain-containing protein n=1 Tax=Mytilus edulis TaxID=6550 RepID=A0A8S3TSY0_MYTED|nr:unnamed protein product [Mytilus edulis]
MAESSEDALKSGSDKENFDRLMSLFRTGTEIKQRLLEYYISRKELNLIDWLSVLSNNFLQFEDVKRAHRRSSTVQSTDLGDNTINTVLMCYCFEMFWDCCLLDTCLESFLNIHKDELYRSYVNSQKQSELPSLSSEPHSTSGLENSTPIITKDQWEFLFKNGENEKCILASNGITVSCLDSYQNIFILSIVCSLFKAVKAVSECQIQISKIAALQCTDISVTLIDGKYRKGSYSLSVIENADLQERINKHNYLKLVQLITNIARNVLVDVLKGRLPETTVGYSFNGMKNRILPLLNEQERQVLYPDNSYYKGDLSDLDISLMYTILRNLNTICPHTNGWGNMPKDDDKDMSANIERIRIFKNKLVSHHPKCSVDTEEFQQTWTEIRACIIQLGGSEYIKTIDNLLTSEINPLMEREHPHS